MKILFPASNWASNIGNPFFTLGIEHVIRTAFPDAEVLPTASNPVLPLKLHGLTERNSFNYSEHSGEVDAIMFAGPMFDTNFRTLFAPAFRRAREAGKKIFLVSAGAITYSKVEADHCRSVLDEFKPDLLWTRDAETFDLFGSHAVRAHSGVCGAWFAPDYYPGYATPSMENYFCSTFDFRPEPATKVLQSAIADAAQLPGDGIDNAKRSARIRRVLVRGLPSNLDGNTIIRPCHRPANRPWTVFTNPNTFAAYTPYGYLNLYRNAKFTITDRLHASVVTMAYGKPTYLYLRSKRGNLLRAAGVEYEHGKRLSVDQLYLAERKAALVSFVADSLAKM